jgi:hypothetical protein
MRSVVDNTNGRKRRDDVRWEKKENKKLLGYGREGLVQLY